MIYDIRDLEIGQVLTIRVIRMAEESVHSTLERKSDARRTQRSNHILTAVMDLSVTYEELVASSGKRSYDFMNHEQRAGSVELDITVMALVYSGVLDSSIDFLASPLPWYVLCGC